MQAGGGGAGGGGLCPCWFAGGRREQLTRRRFVLWNCSLSIGGWRSGPLFWALYHAIYRYTLGHNFPPFTAFAVSCCNVGRPCPRVLVNYMEKGRVARSFTILLSIRELCCETPGGQAEEGEGGRGGRRGSRAAAEEAFCVLIYGNGGTTRNYVRPRKAQN